MEAVTGWWDEYLWGSVVVAKVFVTSLGLTILFGLVGAGAKLSNSKIAQKIAGAYTVIFRGTPEILVILLLYLVRQLPLPLLPRYSTRMSSSSMFRRSGPALLLFP